MVSQGSLFYFACRPESFAPTMFLILLGLVISASVILAAVSTRRVPLLLFTLITNILCILQFSLMDARVGLGTASIGLVRNSTLLLAEKKPKQFGWLNSLWILPFFLVGHVVMFSFMNDWDNMVLLNFAPLIASFLSVSALAFSRMLITKFFMLGAQTLWLCYEFYTQAWGMMVGEVLTIGATIVAIIIIIRSKDTIDTTAVIQDAITTALTLPTHVIQTKIIPVVTQNVTIMRTSAEKAECSTGKIPEVEESSAAPTPEVKLPATKEAIDNLTWHELPSAGPSPIKYVPKG